jgi:predicted permease
MSVVLRLASLLGLVLAGTGLRAVGVLDERRRSWLSDVAFYVALPALVFSSTHDRSLSTLLSPTLVAGVWLVVLGTAGAAFVVHRRVSSRHTRSVAIVQSYHANLGFLGLPLVATSLGDLAAAKASVVLGASLVLHVPMTILLLTTMNDADADLRRELAGVATNPVLVSLAVGLAVAAAGVVPPDAVTTATGGLSELALPLALLAIGASLDLDFPAAEAATTARVVALKVVLMPLISLGVFSALTVSPVARGAAVVMAGTPTAVSTYVYADELGGDERFASLNVFVTTLASMATLFVLVWAFG